MVSTPTEEKVALFGGSFDPVHEGHLAIAAAAVELAGVDRVIFLPTRLSPHKTGSPASAPAEHRLAMLRLATSGLPWAEVSDWEIKQPAPSWSWRTAEHFRGEFPGARLFWILGADQWQAIGDWARPDLLREGLFFLVFPRSPAPPPAVRPGWQSQVLAVEHPASATAIRQALARRLSPVPGLEGAVARYIAGKNLYAGWR